ncbi:laccase [Geomonas limicola]|uniref:Laccase n=1 Tax=Geomonas limicola TaxID=2740186 RepID=A0A6V8NBP6_9BACT|nr:putative Ig domain-containing protein [Geomonas limicola]GFO69217.1 laccase [Geomonas limicola]
MKRRSMFNLMRLLLLLASIPLGAHLAHAGAGIGYSTYSSGSTKVVPTYYANSVSIPDATGKSAQYMRKFVDTLPGLGSANANTLGQYLPVAVAEKWVNGNGVTTNDDYYEIGIVEYTEQMHRDLPKPTTLRGYVQLETPGLLAAGKSAHIQLFYPDKTPIKDNKGQLVYAVDNPHYLGPIIVATRNVAVRIKYSNLLPTGGFNATTGQRNGDLFLPVDKTLMGAGIGPDGINSYTENRAEIHLHGGDNPWISDGTPHQWITPAGENTPYTQGASFVNVPDMPDPGPGSGTLYYPNGDSARLMFYHDHVAGLTRLNVYAGEAAGYLLTDPAGTGEHTLPLPTTQIPLVIQERTFVPTDIATQDALWDTTHWGQPGDLWFPHVYETNQDPTSFDGTNPVGRWDYGPWFWPIFPVSLDLPTGAYGDVTTTPEAFGDTPIINGSAYPVLNVDPTAYRFRVLNASNDRMFNLSLFVADPTVVTDDNRTNTEVRMVPSAPPTSTSVPRACKSTDPVNPATGLQVSAIDETIGGVLVPAGTACWPATWPTDGRDGGVPDPRAAGPKMLHIGTEAGLAPQVSVIPANPTNYEYMRRSVTVLNVLDHALYLAPAERADVVVDFSQYAGQTLILYNDMAAPVPAFDARIDYYTDDPDQTANGGWFTTLAGYGPNTRTLMQINVSGTPGVNGTPYDEAALTAALPAVFAATQPKPIVAEPAFNAALGTNTTKGQYAKIFTGSANQHTFNFVAADTFSYYPENSTSMVTVNPGQVAQVPVLNKAIQELFDPRGRMNATLGVEIPFTGANIQTTVPLGYIDPATESIGDGETQVWKITHNGVDTHPVHFHLVNVQVVNRIGWDGTVKPPADFEVGWKETVRMNPLEDIVVIVRAKKPTLPGFGLPTSQRLLDPTQPVNSTMGFSNLDPLTGNAFPAAQAVKNVMTDFGWEYVWHCHILGHEENDFMRPFIFKVTEPAAAAPTNLTYSYIGAQVQLKWTDAAINEYSYIIQRATGLTGGSFAQIGTALANATTFTDTTAAAGGIYRYNVIAVSAGGNGTASITVAPLTVSTTSLPAGGVNTPYNFGVVAFGGIPGYSWSATGLPSGLSINSTTGVISGTPGNITPSLTSQNYSVSVTVTDAVSTSVIKNFTLKINQTAPAAPTSLTASATQVKVTLNWVNNANNALGVEIQRATNSTFTSGLTKVQVYGPTLSTYTDTTVTPGKIYYYRVRTYNTVLVSSFSNTVTVTTSAALGITTAALADAGVNTPYSQAVTAVAGLAPYTWSATGLPSGLSINASTGVISGTPANVVPLAATSATFAVSITVNDSALPQATASTTLNLKVNQTAPAAPTGLAATPSTGQVLLTWTNTANNAVGVEIQRATNNTFTTGLTKVQAFGPTLSTYTDKSVIAGTVYFYRVRTYNTVLFSTSFSNVVSVTAQ